MDIGLAVVVEVVNLDNPLMMEQVVLAVVVEETIGQTQDLVICLLPLTLVVEAAVALPTKMDLLVVVLVVLVSLLLDIQHKYLKTYNGN